MADLKLNLDFIENIIVYNALFNETYLATIIDSIKPEYFKNNDVKTIFNIIVSFYQKHNVIPNTGEIKAYLVSQEQKNSLKNVLLSFKENQIEGSYNIEELTSNTEQFLKERAIYHAVLETANKYSQDNIKLNTSEILDQFEKACGISLIDNLGHDYFNYVDKHCEILKQDVEYLSTGYKWLDNVMNGGFLKNGRALYVFSGVTNSGKSIIMGNLGCNLLQQNRNVAIISLEMSEEMYTQRIDGQLLNIPIKELKTETDNVKKLTETFKTEHIHSRLFIKEFPTKSVTINHINAYLKQLIQRKKFKPDVLIIDYINLILPTIETGNTYVDIKRTTEKLRALSYIYNIPIITCTQLSRGAYNENDPGIEKTSESIGLAETADFQASIWSTDEDKELNIIHMGIQKNRFGVNYGTKAFKINWGTLRIEETDEDFTNSTEVSNLNKTLQKLGE